MQKDTPFFQFNTPLTQLSFLSFLTFQMLACWRGCSTDHWEKGGFYHEGAKRRTYACSINIKIIIFITDNCNNNFSCITLYLHNSTLLHLRDHLVAATTIDYSTTSGPPTLRLSSLHIFCCNLIFSFWTRPVCISLRSATLSCAISLFDFIIISALPFVFSPVYTPPFVCTGVHVLACTLSVMRSKKEKEEGKKGRRKKA